MAFHGTVEASYEDCLVPEGIAVIVGEGKAYLRTKNGGWFID